MTSVFGYCKADPNIPIDELDYGYIEKCKDINKLQKILEILRSGEEGRYPALEQFTEKQLAKKKPDSPLLEKCSSEKMVQDMPKNDIEKTVEELKNLSSKHPVSMSTEHETTNEDDLPPIRSTKTAKETKLEDTPAVSNHVKKTVVPKGPEYWENLDKEVDADKDGNYENVCKEKSSTSNLNVKTSKPVHELLSQQVRQDKLKKDADFTAENEKNKGNEAFRCGDYKEAMVYYDRSIGILPTAAAYNNRAITLIKLEKFSEALADCEKVIDLEPNNIKAYMRRGIAYQSLGCVDEAHVDFTKVVELEPTNKRGKELLAKVTIELEKKNQSPKKKGTRMKIEEINTHLHADQTNENNYESTGVNTRETSEKVSNDMLNKQDDKASDVNKAEQVKPKESCANIIDSNGPCSLANVMKCINSQKNNIETVPKSSNNEQLGLKEKTSAMNEQPVSELPAYVIEMKNNGNTLYKTGQYDKACEMYTSCINTLSGNAAGYKGALATFYSNRSSCYTKMGNSKQCISDCDKSIELIPSAKVYFKRACAYESLEKYIDAYSDYENVVKLDLSNVNVMQALSRLGNVLRSQYGAKWRDKLPKTTVRSDVDKDEQSVTGEKSDSIVKAPEQSSTGVNDKVTEHSDIIQEIDTSKVNVKQSQCHKEPVELGPESKVGVDGDKELDDCKITEEGSASKVNVKQSNESETTEKLGTANKAAATKTDDEKADMKQNKCQSETKEPVDLGAERKTGAGIVNSDKPQDQHKIVQETETKKTVKHETETKKPVKPETEKKTSDDDIEEISSTRVTKEKLAKEKKILDFFDTKEKGNNLVQKEKYEEAAKCYTKCVELLPKEIPSYTNRALCYLKLKQPVKAIEDCTQALKLQPSCVKALFRRAQARKMTKEYKDALADLTKVLKIEPNNNAAKKEMESCKADFHAELRNIQALNEAAKKKDSTGKSKKVPIEEVDSTEFSIKGKMSTKVGKCPLAKGSTPRSTPLKKMTGFEFLHAWNNVKSEKTADYADLLMQIEPTKLPDLFSNKLDGEILKNFIRTVNEHFTNKDTYKQGIQLFKSLCKVSRFVTMLMFLNTTEKTLLRCAIDQLENRVKQSSDKSLLPEVSSLRTSYRCP